MRSAVVTLPAASGQIFNEGGCVVFHSTRETSGSAAAVYRLWDGTNNAGNLLLTVSLDASESTRDNVMKHMVPFNTGLYYELVSGAVEGEVSALTDHRCSDVIALELVHAMGS